MTKKKTALLEKGLSTLKGATEWVARGKNGMKFPVKIQSSWGNRLIIGGMFICVATGSFFAYQAYAVVTKEEEQRQQLIDKIKESIFQLTEIELKVDLAVRKAQHAILVSAAVDQRLDRMEGMMKILIAADEASLKERLKPEPKKIPE